MSTPLQHAMFGYPRASMAHAAATEKTTASAGSRRRVAATDEGHDSPLGTSGEGRPAPALLDSPMPDGRFLHVAEGSSKVLIVLIESLRSRGYRRVDGAPGRVNEFAAECIDPATHQYRLVWIEPRPAREPKGRARKEVS